jgi:Inner membrane component of T3SS, cytoplasmic domain
MSDDGRIVLTEDDFEGPAADSAAPASTPAPPAGPAGPGTLPPVARRAPLRLDDAPAAAPSATAAPSFPPPLARATPPSGPPALSDPLAAVNDPRLSVLLSAAAGMGAAWLITQLTGVADILPGSPTGMHAIAGLWVAVVAVAFCTIVQAFDRLLAGAWEAAAQRAGRAVLPALVLGFVSGFVASWVYYKISEQAFRHGDFSNDNPLFYLARALGWAVFGAGIGATVGLAEQSQRKAINGMLGGAAGGGIGGFIFQFTGAHIHSQGFSRLVGLLAIGILIAAATFLVETARREAWLRVIAGGMTGKEFILYHDITRVGSSPQCEIFVVKDPSVAALHAQIHDQAGRRTISAAPGAPVLVNGTAVSQHDLRPGDQLQIGATTLAYDERPPVAHPRFPTENPWT